LNTRRAIGERRCGAHGVQRDAIPGPVFGVDAGRRQGLIPAGAVAYAGTLRGVPQVQAPAHVGVVIALVIQQGLVGAGFERLGSGRAGQASEQQGEQIARHSGSVHGVS